MWWKVLPDPVKLSINTSVDSSYLDRDILSSTLESFTSIVKPTYDLILYGKLFSDTC